MADEKVMETSEIVHYVLLKYGVDDAELAWDVFVAMFVVGDLFHSIAPERRGAMSKLVRKLKQTEQQAEEFSGLRLGGIVTDAIDAMARLRNYLIQEPNQTTIGRPKTEGAQRIRAFDVLRKGGVTTRGRCASIIAEILIATGQSDSPLGPLRDTVDQTLRNHLVR